MRLTEEDFEWLDRIGVDSDRLETIKTNQKLRDIIVDFADLWDGKESKHYGDRLQEVLTKIGITDTPDYTSDQEHMTKIWNEINGNNN